MTDIVKRMQRTLNERMKQKKEPMPEPETRGFLGRRAPVEDTPADDDALSMIAEYVKQIREHTESIKNGRK